MFDGEAFGQQMVEIVRGYVATELEPLRAENTALAAENKALADRLSALEVREMPDTSAFLDAEGVAGIVKAEVAESLAGLPAPEKGEPGRDGLGLANALIDRDGCLVVTFTDGSDKNLGLVVGKDGENGKDGETFTLDDFDIEPLDERTIKLKFAKGEVVHSFELAFPVPVYRGVFKDGESYERGDMVTWGGDLWHAERATSQKPATDDWRLAVRKGRDAK